MLQIDLLKSKRHLLDLARSLTCYKHEKFLLPESHILKPNEKIEHEGSKVQERILEKKVKKSVGWDKFKDVFMVSAVLNQGSSDIEVRYYTVFIKLLSVYWTNCEMFYGTEQIPVLYFFFCQLNVELFVKSMVCKGKSLKKYILQYETYICIQNITLHLV